jgi:stage V sporulation protein G
MAVHGLRILESEKGLFVAMPSRSYTDRNGETKYSDVAHPVTAEARTAINESVLAAYNQELSENESLAEDISDQDLSFEQDI